MYEELVERLRTCGNSLSCNKCKWSLNCGGTGDVLRKAADAIEELTDKNVWKWIPVTERLPEELAEVNIAWMNTAPAPYYDFIKDKTFTGSAVYYKGKWFWYSAVCRDYLSEYGFSPNDSMDDAIKVTHWMPLPIAPESNNEK